MSKSIFYKYPWFYLWGLKWIHKDNFAKRYRYMASFIKKGDFVLEPGCGPGILADFLPKGTKYRGFDTNKAFVEFAIKKDRDVFLGNVLDPQNYSQADVVVVCDVLHHLAPQDREKFINYCFKSTKKKLIICEPVSKKRSKRGFLNQLRNRLVEWSEQDGTGNFKVEHFMTKKDLFNDIKNGFGIIPSSTERAVKKIGEDFIIVFDLE